MRISRQSEGIKKGEPADHEKAVQRVVKFWEKYGIAHWKPRTDVLFHFNKQFRKEKKVTNTFGGHAADLVFVTERFNYSRADYNEEVRLIVEVDGQRHDNYQPRINDGVFQDYIDEQYSGTVQVIRLRKDELLGQTSDVETYLRDKLKGFLK